MTAKNEETMFTITTISYNITIGRDLPPTSPAIRLDERGIQVNGARPLDLAPGESTIVEYPISERDETSIRRIRCKVTREYEPTENIATALGQQPPQPRLEVAALVEEKVAEQVDRRAKKGSCACAASGDCEGVEDDCSCPCHEGPRVVAISRPASLAATIERAREATENAQAPRRGGRRSARRGES